MTGPKDPAPQLTASIGLFPRGRRRESDILIGEAPRSEAGGFVLAALRALRNEEEVRTTRTALERAGQTESVAKLTQKLNAAGLNRVERLLLSVPGVYAGIIAEALRLAEDEKLKLEDTAGMFNFVRRRLNRADDGPRAKYVRLLLDGALRKRGMSIPEDARKVVEQALMDRNDIPDQADAAEAAISGVVNEYRERGSLARAVDYFATKDEIDPLRFTDAVRRSMIAYLDKLGLKPTDQGLARGDFDEYLALAYNQAIAGGDGGTADPIDAVHQKGFVVDLNFDVDQFDGVEEQGVIPDNIMAAGALDYIYNLGERLGIFRLADTVVLKWGSGSIDLDPGETPAKLYRYWKLRNERTSPEERGMLYTRVLNKGDGQMLEGMVANEAFPDLWGALMTAVTDYIARVEEKKTEEYSVSRQRIYQATKQLQYNLSEFTTGMAHMQISEMYHHLQEARGILEDSQVVDFFGSGRRKTIWTVIDRGSKEWFGSAPNIAAIRDCAVQGNKVFQWMSRFDQATVSDQDFNEFKDAAEAWILAQVADGSEPAAAGPAAEEPSDTSGDAAKDDFDSDWDK